MDAPATTDLDRFRPRSFVDGTLDRTEDGRQGP